MDKDGSGWVPPGVWEGDQGEGGQVGGGGGTRVHHRLLLTRGGFLTFRF